jgi:hypothetical protein
LARQSENADDQAKGRDKFGCPRCGGSNCVSSNRVGGHLRYPMMCGSTPARVPQSGLSTSGVGFHH